MTPDFTSQIPETLTQFWDKPELPADIAPKVESWREKSGLTPRMFNEESALEFISEAYGAELALSEGFCVGLL